jgi:hypothetical protein
LAAVRAELSAALSAAPPERPFSFGERFTRDGAEDLGWHVRWAGGRLDFEAVPSADVDVELVVDLEVAHRSSAPMTPELKELQRAAVRDGRIVWRGDATSLPPALAQVHDRMATLTLPP